MVINATERAKLVAFMYEIIRDAGFGLPTKIIRELSPLRTTFEYSCKPGEKLANDLTDGLIAKMKGVTLTIGGHGITGMASGTFTNAYQPNEGELAMLRGRTEKCKECNNTGVRSDWHQCGCLTAKYTPTVDEQQELQLRIGFKCKQCSNSGVALNGKRCGCLDRKSNE